MFRGCSDADDDIRHEATASMLIAHRYGTILRGIATGAACSTSCYSPDVVSPWVSYRAEDSLGRSNETNKTGEQGGA